MPMRMYLRPQQVGREFLRGRSKTFLAGLGAAREARAALINLDGEITLDDLVEAAGGGLRGETAVRQ